MFFPHWLVFIVTSVVVVFFTGYSLLEYKKELKRKVAQLQEQHKEMKRLATYDKLTGLSLMSFAEEKIEDLLDNRVDDSHIAVLFLDVDNFKLINDKHGHDAGDSCLKFIANSIQNFIRKGDEACRIGGDEMVVICSNISSEDIAIDLAERLVAEVSKGFNYFDQFINVSVSIGVSIAPLHSNKFKDLKRCADQAMYQAKKHETSQVVMYSEHLETI